MTSQISHTYYTLLKNEHTYTPGLNSLVPHEDTWLTFCEYENIWRMFDNDNYNFIATVTLCSDSLKVEQAGTRTRANTWTTQKFVLGQPIPITDWLISRDCKDVRKHGKLLRFVPYNLRTESLCLAAIMSGSDNGMCLEYVPEEIITQRMCTLAVHFSDGQAFHFVPSQFYKQSLCLHALKYKPDYIRLLPASIKTPEFLRKALKSKHSVRNGNPHILKFLTDVELTPALCEYAVENCLNALAFLPANKLTPALVELAVHRDPCSLQFIGDSPLCTEAICIKVVRVNRDLSYPLRLLKPLLSYIPEQHKTLTVCLAAVQTDGLNLEYVPIPMMEDNLFLCMEAVKQCGIALESVPNNLKTPELCLAAVNQDATAMEFVPNDKQTDELCQIAYADEWAREFIRDDWTLSLPSGDDSDVDLNNM